jgi:hypothetical protein
MLPNHSKSFQINTAGGHSLLGCSSLPAAADLNRYPD